jgi:hypothetical protein
MIEPRVLTARRFATRLVLFPMAFMVIPPFT